MGSYIVKQLIKAMLKKRIQVQGSKILVMGLTFKENCPDIRNTKVVDILRELNEFGVDIDCYDPWVNKEQAKSEYKINPITEPLTNAYDAIILAVAHEEFKQMGETGIRSLGKDSHIVYDLKYILEPTQSDMRL